MKVTNTELAFTRRQFLRRSAAALAVAGSGVPALLAASPAASASELLADAPARIERQRKADGVVRVRNARGRLQPGAQLHIEQVRHDFRFGCNFYLFESLPTPALEAQYRQRFAALFNSATLGFYWALYEPQRGQPHYAATDRAVAWCAEHLIECKGTPLVWDQTDCSPRWLPPVLIAVGELISDRVEEIVSRYRGRIDTWEVVNEPTHVGNPVYRKEADTPIGQYAASLGPRVYTAEYLKVARAANPKATLLVNDYRTDLAYYVVLDSLRQNGRLLFDAVGLQSHMHSGRWSLDSTWAVCERFAPLGVPLHFTETTILSGRRLGSDLKYSPTEPALEAEQAEAVEQFYTLLFSHPAVEAITWWDLSDLYAWRSAPAGLLRADLSTKPAYDRLKDLVKRRWWTRAEGTTNTRGEFPLRGFTGLYKITATLPDGRTTSRVVPWQRGADNRHDLTVQ